jgi:hypothetical protein
MAMRLNSFYPKRFLLLAAIRHIPCHECRGGSLESAGTVLGARNDGKTQRPRIPGDSSFLEEIELHVKATSSPSSLAVP